MSTFDLHVRLCSSQVFCHIYLINHHVYDVLVESFTICYDHLLHSNLHRKVLHNFLLNDVNVHKDSTTLHYCSVNYEPNQS